MPTLALLLLLLPGLAWGAPDDVTKRFVEMRKAYKAHDMTKYGEALRDYLANVDNGDADVAFLYAMYLAEYGTPTANETLRWANVAIANRHQWPDEVYTLRLQPLYQERIEATLLLWKAAMSDYNDDQSNDSWQRAQKYQQLAAHYFRVSSPCLLEEDCGPHFTVEVDETPTCDTLDPDVVAQTAAVGRLEIGAVVCLEELGATQPTMRRWVRDILLDNAEANETIPVWTRLTQWHFETFGAHDADVLVGYVRQLAAQGESAEDEAKRWAGEALKLALPEDLATEMRKISQ